MKIKFTKSFKKQYQKAPSKIQKIFDRKITLFIKNRYNPLLRNHALSGKLRGYKSINITGDWRAIFIENKRNKKVVAIFVLLGTHSKLYK